MVMVSQVLDKHIVGVSSAANIWATGQADHQPWLSTAVYPQLADEMP